MKSKPYIAQEFFLAEILSCDAYKTALAIVVPEQGKDKYAAQRLQTGLVNLRYRQLILKTDNEINKINFPDSVSSEFRLKSKSFSFV